MNVPVLHPKAIPRPACGSSQRIDRRAEQPFIQIIADDHVTVRRGLKLLIDAERDMEVIGEAGDGNEVVQKPRELNLLITGHDDDKKFIDQVVAAVDLATEMRKVKHPFDEGHQARKGLDY